MAWMFNHGDGRSLFLVDEFGKGTAELDGIALLSSIINHLAKKDVTTGRPRVVLTTHFLEIFRNNLLEPTLVVDQSVPQDGVDSTTVEHRDIPSNTSRVICTVMASTDASESYSATASAAPLYELRFGISSHSNALACAAKCGVPEKLVERSQDILDCTKRGVPIPPRQQLPGPSPEEQLVKFFASINDWKTAGDETIAKFFAIARMGAQ